MFKKILVAIDRSEAAACAAATASDLASQLDAQVAVLHVIDYASALIPELGVRDEKVLAQLREQGETLIRDVAIVPSLNPTRLLIEGDPAETIVTAAQEWGADLIIIGSDSRGRLAHFLVGSTADAVIRRASCPVVTVRARGPVQQKTHTLAAAVAL
jgi:nucleotide-binding universal stress UspA family protein